MPTYQDPKAPFTPDRTRLPIEEPIYPPITEPDIAKVPPPPRFKLTPPEGAPNVLVVLIDDMGFGASSAFGGPIPMPNAERLAKRGMRFNRFHTTGVCAPTRTALLSGYNHHTNNMGQISEMGTAYPGNTSTRPQTVTPVARVLKDNGYNTAHFGKCHEVPVWEVSHNGPFTHWPTFSGMEKFYGFLAAETDQFNPELYDGVTMLEKPDDPDYHLSEDLAKQCIQWMKQQKAMNPNKPFFTYFAPGATHAPHQSPPKYRDMFKGRFDEGWDVMREKTLENMKKLGVCPPDTVLAPKHPAIYDWDDVDDKHKELFRRQIELYAGYAHHIDEQVGYIFDALEEMGIMDDTLVFYILGDNGASAEGMLDGVFNEMTAHNLVKEPFEFVYSKLDEMGTEYASNHYSACWAVALDAPFEYVKAVPSDFGGTRNGMIVHYPAKYAGAGEMHPQFHHVIDIAPTILDIAGIPIPEYVDGIKQRPMEGVSMKYAFENKDAPGTRKTQYFDIGRNWGIYHDEWFAGCTCGLPWEVSPDLTWDQIVAQKEWTLYDLSKDFACANDLAKVYPEKLAEMKKIYFDECVKYNVLPIETRAMAILNPEIAGRPSALDDPKSLTLSAGMIGIKESAFINTKNHSFRITADVEVDDNHRDGVILSLGNRFGGYSLYVKDGIPSFCYNFFGMERYYTRGTKPLEAGKSQIVLDFKYDGGGMGKGGATTLTVNNAKQAEGRVERTTAAMFELDGVASCGLQRQSPVTDDYTVENSRFKGNIYQVNISVTD